ncbi:MAG TPA: vWA domain-containing protein [Labilithrix sp.]|nr:vWA domain-containing protein [Labilithrix sp.]
MRKGLLFLSPFALITGLVMACTSATTRSGFPTEPPVPDSGPGFEGLGNLADAGTDGSEPCSSSKTEISRVPVVIEFLVDESSSMNSDNKWTAARDALMAAFTDMEATADPATFIGLYLYPKNEKVAPESLTVSGHLTDLLDVIDVPSGTGSNTPTEAALKSAYGVVEKFKPPASSGLVPDQMNRVVVLLSDGVPDNGAAGQQGCEDLAEEKFAETPPKGPILTFSVGIGDPSSASSYSYDPKFMGRLAQKGGTAPAGCDVEATDPAAMCHFQITPGQDAEATKVALLEALNKIRALTTSCEYTLTINESSDLGAVVVELTDKDGNKTPIPKDPENGWSFNDPSNPTKVVLRGEACSASNGTVSGRVDVTIGCRSAN